MKKIQQHQLIILIILGSFWAAFNITLFVNSIYFQSESSLILGNLLSDLLMLSMFFSFIINGGISLLYLGFKNRISKKINIIIIPLLLISVFIHYANFFDKPTSKRNNLYSEIYKEEPELKKGLYIVEKNIIGGEKKIFTYTYKSEIFFKENIHKDIRKKYAIKGIDENNIRKTYIYSDILIQKNILMNMSEEEKKAVVKKIKEDIKRKVSLAKKENYLLKQKNEN